MVISWRTLELQQTASKGRITGATMTSATERNGRVAQRWLVQQSGIAGMTEWDGWCSGMGAMVQRSSIIDHGWCNGLNGAADGWCSWMGAMVQRSSIIDHGWCNRLNGMGWDGWCNNGMDSQYNEIGQMLQQWLPVVQRDSRITTTWKWDGCCNNGCQWCNEIVG